MPVNIFHFDNGEFRRQDATAFYEDDRAFRYGDGFFESFRIIDKEIRGKIWHQKRIEKSLDITGISTEWTTEDLLTKVEAISPGGIVRGRLQINRSGGSAYDPQASELRVILSASPMQEDIFHNSDGISLCVSKDILVHYDILSGIKSCSALRYVMAKKEAREYNTDDCIILSSDGKTVAETSSSNIFFIHNDKLFTPSMQTGCVEGTVRQRIIHLAKIEGIPIQSGNYTLADLKNADCVFLTNAIRGIQVVSRIEGTPIRTTHQLLPVLREHIH